MTSSPRGNMYRPSWGPRLVAGTPARSHLPDLPSEADTARGGQSQDLSPQSARTENRVIPVRVDARYLASILEQGVADATGYVTVMLDVGAGTVREAAPAQADVVGQFGPISQRKPKLHPEPFG